MTAPIIAVTPVANVKEKSALEDMDFFIRLIFLTIVPMLSTAPGTTVLNVRKLDVNSVITKVVFALSAFWAAFCSSNCSF